VSFLLDTNICSAHLRRPSGLSHRFVQHSGRLFIPTIVAAELYTWAYKQDVPTKFLAAIKTLLENEVQVLPYDKNCAMEFGKINGELLRQGITISPVDLLIASVARVHDLTLVTNNVADFSAIPDLSVVDWLAS
jgi:tRNA(fMet)-specific endonuclease VapC